MPSVRAIAFDAFGTLIQFGGARLKPYRLLLGGKERFPFHTRNVPAATFAAEQGIEHILPEFERELNEELAGLKLFAEVPEVLDSARRAGLRIAVCSNLAQAYGVSVRQLLPGLDAYILSFEIGAAKPQPEIFAATCQALNSAPAEVLFVGDSQRCDLRGPRAFGMPARWLDRTGGQNLFDALVGILPKQTSATEKGD
jgi:HAD superfamily hydrolase (TIGR01549 family)